LFGSPTHQHHRHGNNFHTGRYGHHWGVAERIVQDAVDAGAETRDELNDRRRDAIDRAE